MSDLLNATLGAVGQVGDAIDKATGGRAVRGALAGKPRELASVIPFSDSMGLTNAKDATSGRDLTDSYGLTTKGDNSFGSHAAGFLADNVLSPGNWLGAAGAIKAAPTLGKGLIGGAKALTGLDILDNVGRGVNAIGKKFGYLPAPHIPQYGRNADLVGAYNEMSKGFPSSRPPEMYHAPEDLLSSHVGAMPDAAGMSLERNNNLRIDQQTGRGQPHLPSDYFDHQTVLPGMTDDPLKAVRKTVKDGDIYGLARPNQAKAAKEAADIPMSGNVIEPAGGKPIPLSRKKMTDSPGYVQLPHELPELPEAPTHGPDDDLVAAYEKLRGNAMPDGDTSAMHSYQPPEGLADVVAPHQDVFANEAQQTAQQATAAATPPPTLIDRIFHGLGIGQGRATGDLKPAKLTARDSRLDWDRLMNDHWPTHSDVPKDWVDRYAASKDRFSSDLKSGALDNSPAVSADDIARRHGVDLGFGGAMPAHIREELGMPTDNTLAWSGPQGITLNANQPSWVSSPQMKAIMEHNFKTGWLSSGDVNGIAWHELGHQLHPGSGGMYGRDVPAGLVDKIKSGISEYGSKNVPESVAEIVAAHAAGRPIPPEILDYYKSVGGPDFGDLKPSLLSMLTGQKKAPGSAFAQSTNGVELPWQRAVRIGNAAGVNVDPTTKIAASVAARNEGWPADRLHLIPAWYSGKNNKITLNPHSPEWNNNQAMLDSMHFNGPGQTEFTSTSNPDHFVHHELGHAFHHDSVGLDRFLHDPELNTPFDPGSDEHYFLMQHLGTYGATAPDEMVAELAAALQGGRQLNPDLAGVLQHYGGPQMFQRLGDMGLLKGLGLSLLGTLGVGAANQENGV